jgi:hypothetical protein
MKKALKLVTAIAVQTALATMALVEPFKPIDTTEKDEIDRDGIGLLEANMRIDARPLLDDAISSLENAKLHCEQVLSEASGGLTAYEINGLTELINTLANAANLMV